jgi:hypothetical protein
MITAVYQTRPPHRSHHQLLLRERYRHIEHSTATHGIQCLTCAATIAIIAAGVNEPKSDNKSKLSFSTTGAGWNISGTIITNVGAAHDAAGVGVNDTPAIDALNGRYALA